MLAPDLNLLNVGFCFKGELLGKYPNLLDTKISEHDDKDDHGAVSGPVISKNDHDPNHCDAINQIPEPGEIYFFCVGKLILDDSFMFCQQP